MFLRDKQHIAIAAGFVALAGIAIAGWTHHGSAPVVAAVSEPGNMPVTSVAAEADYGPGQSTDGYYADIDRPVYVRQAAPPPPLPVTAQYDAEPAYYTHGREDRRHHHRSFTKSVAIVAGSAGAGAAIGAIAGGGPGAAIGAIAGGTGGFIYDRSTAHHRH